AQARPATAEGDTARKRDLDTALHYLEFAVTRGFSDWVQAEWKLTALKDDPAFARLIERMQSPEDLYKRAQEASKSAKSRDEATRLCGVVLERDPKYAPAYSTRGYALALNKDFPAAVADMQCALLLRPKVAGSSVNMALVLCLRAEARP